MGDPLEEVEVEAVVVAGDPKAALGSHALGEPTHVARRNRMKLDTRGKRTDGSEDRSDSFGVEKLPQAEARSARLCGEQFFLDLRICRCSAHQTLLPRPGLHS